MDKIIKKDRDGFYIDYFVPNGPQKGDNHRIRGEFRKCKKCGYKFFAQRKQINLGYGFYCSCKCSPKWDSSGKNNGMWKGGKMLLPAGYVYILDRKHPYAGKSHRIMEHRLIMEQYLGRYLKPNEKVHHINKNKSDNRIENLMLFSNNSEHMKYELLINPNIGFQNGHPQLNTGRTHFKSQDEYMRNR